jgi:exodeoxyribonuclease V alpha subunit
MSAIVHQSLHCFPVFRKTRPQQTGGKDAFVAGLRRTFTMTAGDGANLDLAYSISVHKSQGSQWSRVIVPVFPSRILDRTLAYTAITRAAEQVILLGDRTAFQRAVEATAAVDRRETCLSARLDELLGDNEVEPAPPLTSDRIP